MQAQKMPFIQKCYSNAPNWSLIGPVRLLIFTSTYSSCRIFQCINVNHPVFLYKNQGNEVEIQKLLCLGHWPSNFPGKHFAIIKSDVDYKCAVSKVWPLQSALFYYTEVQLKGGPGGPESPRNLENQLTLFKPRWADFSPHTAASSPGFKKLSTPLLYTSCSKSHDLL